MSTQMKTSTTIKVRVVHADRDANQDASFRIRQTGNIDNVVDSTVDNPKKVESV